MNATLKRWRLWLWPRRVDTPPLTLDRRRIYVLPTTAGMLYASTLMLMLVASINYSLSLGYALTFLLAGLGIVAIVQSFRNLAGLQLSPTRHTPGFAGDQTHFGIQLDTLRSRGALSLQLAGGDLRLSDLNAQETLQLALPAQQRGWQAMPRLTIASAWPLGLVRAWSYAYFEERCLVYPEPAARTPAWPQGGGERRRAVSDEPDDFVGLRPHRSGDLPQHVAWKASARLEDELLSKQFAGERGQTLWFDLAEVPGATLDAKLSILTRWVLDAQAAQQNYGLRLGSTQIAPSNSAEHMRACLRALALHA